MVRAIDVGGLSQFYTGWKELSPSMLLEYTLKEAIHPEKMQDALKRATGIFSVFRVRIALNDRRQPVYETVESDPVLYREDGKQHAFGKESGGYLFRVSYDGNRILLSMHHALTDFFGANEFLKYILRCYLHLTDDAVDISENTIAADVSDLRDPYDLYGDIRSAGYSPAGKWKNELIVPSHIIYRREIPQPTCSIVFSAEKILQTAIKSDTSVFPLLSWLIANAAAVTYGAEDRIVTGGGSADFRKIYHSRTPLNFSQSFSTVLLPREKKMSPELQLTVQRFRMDLMTDRDTTDREIALRRQKIKQMNGPIEAYVMNQEELDCTRREMEKQNAFFLIYTGRMDLPEDLAEYTESFFFACPTTRGPLKIVAYSWKGSITLNITEQACEKSIIPELQGILDRFSTQSRRTGSGMKCYDYYPMEELLQNGMASE